MSGQRQGRVRNATGFCQGENNPQRRWRSFFTPSEGSILELPEPMMLELYGDIPLARKEVEKG